MKTITIHFDDTKESKDVNLETIDGCFYDGGNDPYKPVKCCEICYAEFMDGEQVSEDVLHYLELIVEDSKDFYDLNDIYDIIDYLEYFTECTYK